MRKLMILVLLCGLSLASFAQQKKAKPLSPQASIATDLVTSLSKGDFEHAWSLYDASIKSLLGVDQIKKNWQDIELRHGKFVKTTRASSEIQNGVEVIYILCHFENGKVKFKSTLNANKEVTSFLILKETEK